MHFDMAPTASSSQGLERELSLPEVPAALLSFLCSWKEGGSWKIPQEASAAHGLGCGWVLCFGFFFFFNCPGDCEQ